MEEQDSRSPSPNKGISTTPQSDVGPLASGSAPFTTLSPSPSSPMPPMPPPPPPLPTSAAQPSQVNEGENQRKRKEPERKPPKTSQVWDHFVKISLEETNGEIRAYCKHYNNTYACDPNKHGTTSLKRHLLKCSKNPNKADNDKKQPMLQYLSNAYQGRALVPHVYNEKRIRRALAEFIICDELPFRIVEKSGFKKFVKELEPRFRIPSRITIGRDCWQLYLGEIKVLKKILKTCATRVCLTTDCWTSNQNFNYLCLTAHFIDPDWNLHKRIINFCMVEDHKGDTIGKTIERCLLDWGIEKVFTITMDNASSNASALSYLKKRLKSWRGLICNGDYLHLRCCAHILNLIVCEGLKDLKDNFDSIRSAVKYVRSSPTRLAKFKTFAEAEKVDTKSLVCLDVSTRWNSTFLMLEAALKFQKVFDRMSEEDYDYCAYFAPPRHACEEHEVFMIESLAISNNRRDSRDFFKRERDAREEKQKQRVEKQKQRDSPPCAEDWNRARVFLKFLKVFYDITLMFSSSINVTSNSCFHQIARVQQMLERNVLNSDSLLADMAINMTVKYEKYWGKAEIMNPLLIVAVILDPRYKLAYVNDIFENLFHDNEVCLAMKDRVKDCLYLMFEEYSASVGVSPESSIASSSTTPSCATSVEGNVDDHDPGLQWLAKVKQKSSNDSQTELKKYLAADSSDDVPVSTDFNILAWWKVNSVKYKILSCMARDVLAIPVSTVASESAFSTGGRVVDQYRSSLSPKMTEALICSQNWLLPGQSLLELAEQLRQFDNFEESDASCVTDVGTYAAVGGAAAVGRVAAVGGAATVGGAAESMENID